MTDEEKLKALDPKNPFTQAIKDWAIQTKRRSSTALLLPYFSQISILRRSVWRTGI